ncbi:MAG: hypothetical protein AMXMBFR64_04940 [Myxococcales bacterium]
MAGKYSEQLLDAIRRATDLHDLCRELGIPGHREGRGVKYQCPLHGDSSDGKWNFDVRDKRSRENGKCYSCGKSADAFGVWQAVRGGTFPDAVQALASRAGIRLDDAAGPPPASTPAAGASRQGAGAQAKGPSLCSADWIPPKKGEVVAQYPYVDEAGRVLFEVLRFSPKSFAQRRPGPHPHSSLWLWTLEPVQTARLKGREVDVHLGPVRRVPYLLPAVLAAGKRGERVWFVEGEKDVRTLQALGLTATTSPQGAKSWAESKEEVAKAIAGAHVVVLCDNDGPGRAFAAEVVSTLAASAAASVRLLDPLPALPGYQPAEHDDVTVWVRAGGTRPLLETAAASAPPAEPPSTDPAAFRVANFLARMEADADGNESMRRYSVPLNEILRTLHQATGGWPRTINGLLFAHEPPASGTLPAPDAIRPLNNDAELFAWLKTKGTEVSWTGREVVQPSQLGTCAPVSRNELLAGARMASPARYVAAELLPHHPPRPLTFYSCGHIPSGNGKALDEFVGMLNPASDHDRDLLRALIVTLLWGGEPGARPGWVITSEHGVGTGKTTTAIAIAAIVGGCVGIRPNDDWAKTSERLLSDNALSKRVVLIDNLKGRLNSSEFESAITDGTINGKRMYHGDYERPNTLTWVFTVNIAELSRDLADRCVVVNIGRARHGVDFRGAAQAFLESRRYELVADILAHLRAAPLDPITTDNADRFQSWQQAVLSRFPNGNELAALAKERRPTVDSDASDAREVAASIADLIRERGYCPVHEHIFIPTRELATRLHPLFGTRTDVGLKAKLKSLAHDKSLHPANFEGRLAGIGTRGADWFPLTAIDTTQRLLGPALAGVTAVTGKIHCSHCTRGTTITTPPTCSENNVFYPSHSSHLTDPPPSPGYEEGTL